MYGTLNTIQSTLATTSNALTKTATPQPTASSKVESEEVSATANGTDNLSISSSALELYTSSLSKDEEENKEMKQK